MRTHRPVVLLAVTATACIAALVVAPAAPAATTTTLTTPGIYQCVVGGSGPQTLNYSVSGGMGGGYSSQAAGPGYGANLAGTMDLTGGQTVYITVGSNGVFGAVMPDVVGSNPTYSGSGGGGYSSISLGQNSSPIVIAGGGGGGGSLNAMGGTSLAGTKPQGKGGGGNGGPSGNQGIQGGVTDTAGKAGPPGGGAGGNPGGSGGTAEVDYGAGGGGAGFGGGLGGNGDASGFPTTGWTTSAVAYGGGGGAGAWAGGGGGGWAGGGGGAGSTPESGDYGALGGGGGGGSSLLAPGNTAGVTATTSSVSAGSRAGSASLDNVTCSTSVTYMANGGQGTAPTDTAWYAPGASAQVLSGSGLTGPAAAPFFIGWGTSPGGAVSYAPGQTVTVNGPVTLWAVYTAGAQVTFNANGGTGSMAPQSALTPTALTANAFANVGYGFTGWNTAANGSGTAYAPGATFPFSSSATLYAQWAPIVTVTFNGNGQTTLYGQRTYYQTGYQPTPLNSPQFALWTCGCTFTNWSTNPDGTGTTYANGAVYPFNASVTLYGQYALLGVVNFMPNGGSGSFYTQVSYGPTPLTLNQYTNTGYVFTGWNTAADGSGTAYANGAVFTFVGTVGTNLYAQWALPSATVTFDANGGTGTMAPQDSGVPANLTANAFTNGSLSFTGWNTAPDGSGTAYANGALYAFNADTTLYAQWSAPSTVTFDANGGTGTMAPQSSGVPASLTLNSFTYPSYAFTSWNTAPDGSGTKYTNGAVYSFTAPTTLYAQWSQTVFTITFNSNPADGGYGTMAPQSESAGIYNLALNTFTNTNSILRFSSWNTQPDGTGSSFGNGAPFTFSSDTTLYAQWITTVYSVGFSPNGGTGFMSDQFASQPTQLDLNTFARPGYTFTGWNTEPDGSGESYANGATFPFNFSPTLYAQWIATPPVVTFEANGGSGTMSPQVSAVPAPLAPTTFTNGGLVFTGWNTAANGTGSAYGAGATFPFTSDATLYAQWSTPPFVVTFSANGGSGVMNAQADTAPTALTPNAFTRTGFVFTGWNTAANGSGTAYANGATYPFAANATLYAQWGPAPSTVTFNANGGRGTMAPQSATGPTALEANSFTRRGYAFAGWNTAADGSGTAYADGATYPFSASTTLYAQWEDIASRVVVFDPNGGTGVMLPQRAARPTALRLNAYTRSGYTFIGWNAAADGSGVSFANGSLYPFGSDVVLYAQWVPSSTAIVTFRPNGGIGAMSPQVSTTPAKLATNAFSRAGYAFTGWNTASTGSGTRYANGATFPFAASVTLYAQWAPIPGTVRGAAASQTAAGQATVTWSPLANPALTYRVRLVTSNERVVGSCSTKGRSCVIRGIPRGSYNAAITAVSPVGAVGKPALAGVVIRVPAITIQRSWRGTGSQAGRVYARVTMSTGTDPEEVMVWIRATKNGKPISTRQPATITAWSCTFSPRRATICTWSRAFSLPLTVTFEVYGISSNTVHYPAAT